MSLATSLTIWQAVLPTAAIAVAVFYYFLRLVDAETYLYSDLILDEEEEELAQTVRLRRLDEQTLKGSSAGRSRRRKRRNTQKKKSQ
jgi:hypothetical protein